jgi:hypothetical protein
MRSVFCLSVVLNIAASAAFGGPPSDVTANEAREDGLERQVIELREAVAKLSEVVLELKSQLRQSEQGGRSMTTARRRGSATTRPRHNATRI